MGERIERETKRVNSVARRIGLRFKSEVRREPGDYVIWTDDTVAMHRKDGKLVAIVSRELPWFRAAPNPQAMRELRHQDRWPQSPERGIWRAMKKRCLNPRHKSYANYGGRGIMVCDRWRNSFQNFLDDMGARPSPEHSLGRIDNDGPYSPENCRWETAHEQHWNTRVVCPVSLDGVEMPVSVAADALGVTTSCLKYRMRKQGHSRFETATFTYQKRRTTKPRAPVSNPLLLTRLRAARKEGT
jgi:hypothetical protein